MAPDGALSAADLEAIEETGPPPDACAECITCEITSQTLMDEPANRARTRLGVGERVRLTFSLGAAVWSKSGPGAISATSGATIRYRAADTAGSATITAVGSGCSASISLQIVAPSEVHMRRRSGINVMHTHGRPDIGMQLDFYIAPDDVNFHRVRFHELDAPVRCTGVYAEFDNHSHDEHPHTIPMTSHVVAGRGTKADGFDDAYTGDPNVEPPFAAGTENCRIPYQYRVGSGPWHNFTTLLQHADYNASSHTARESKGGASGHKSMNDATVGYYDFVISGSG